MSFSGKLDGNREITDAIEESFGDSNIIHMIHCYELDDECSMLCMRSGIFLENLIDKKLTFDELCDIPQLCICGIGLKPIILNFLNFPPGVT